MKKIFLEKSEELILKSFIHARIPEFAKVFDLAEQNSEYLAGLCSRCLNGDNNLTFSLNITGEEESTIQEYIEKYYNNYESWVYYYLMKTVNLILHKYYNFDGFLKH